MDAFFSILSPAVLVFAVGVTLLGGFVKGAIGFALPLVMVSGMGILIEPKVVVACIVIPILITNVYQVARAGWATAWSVAVEHWRFTLAASGMILISAQFLNIIPANVMFFVLGVTVVVLCGVQLAGWRPVLPPNRKRPFEWGAGIAAGSIGGLVGTWGPPTVMYLLALEIPRARQMAVQGVIFGLGSVMLFAGHVRSGVLNAETWPLSAALVVPALVGMWLGFKLGDRFDQDRFRKVTLLVLIVAGANLIRRGVMG